MNIYVILRNLYGNPDPFEEELILGDSDINAISEACELRDRLNSGQRANGDIGQSANRSDILEIEKSKVTALLFSESEADYKTVLVKAASYGADEVIHVPVDNFDFSDSNTFSRLIASVIETIVSKNSNQTAEVPNDTGIKKQVGEALVFFGRLAYDGDSVNIATQTAENLKWHRAIYSQGIAGLSPDKLVFKKALDDGAIATTEVPLPCVIHSIRKAGLRRQAKIADIIRAYNETEVKTLDSDLVTKAIESSTRGSHLTSPIQEIPPYISKGDMVVLNGISDVDTARNIIETLKNLGFEPK